VRAFHRGDEVVTPWEDPETNVWGLRVPKSVADFLILRTLRESGGTAVSVPEASIESMQRRAAEHEGLLVGPEGAAALVAVGMLTGEGLMQRGQRVLVFQTGHPANYK